MPLALNARAALATFIAAGSLLVGILFTVSALAGEPISRAKRLATERVRLETVAMANDGCTFIGAVTAGAPAGEATEADTFPVTVRLRRSPGAQICTMAAKVLKDESMLTVPARMKALQLYVLKPEGGVHGTQRVTIQ